MNSKLGRLKHAIESEIGKCDISVRNAWEKVDKQDLTGIFNSESGPEQLIKIKVFNCFLGYLNAYSHEDQTPTLHLKLIDFVNTFIDNADCVAPSSTCPIANLRKAYELEAKSVIVQLMIKCQILKFTVGLED